MFFSQGKHHILFGCNMVIRRAVLSYEKFDENLPLYAYGEDYDISIRLERYGLVGRFEGCVGVHLETPGGRVSEVLRGYSFVANNWYFMKKGVIHLPLLHGVDSLLVDLCWKEHIDKSLESAKRRSISGLEWKAKRTSIGSKRYFPGLLPSRADQGNVKRCSRFPPCRIAPS